MKTIPKISSTTLLMGNMSEFDADSIAALNRWEAEGGPVCEVRFGPVRQVIVTDAAIAQHVLQKNNKNYQKEKFTNLQIRKALPKDAKDDLFTADGAEWLRRRRLMQPAFHRKVIANFGTLINEEIANMFTQWDQVAADQSIIELEDELNTVTMEITMRAMFSTSSDGNIVELKSAANRVSREIAARLNDPKLGQTTFLPTARNRQFTTDVKTLSDTIRGIIAERVNAPTETEDLLDMLLMAKDAEVGDFTEAEVIAEMTGMLFAGHETTTSALMWTLYALATNPDWLQKLQVEVDGALNGAAPQIGMLTEMPLLTRVLKEALRMYPPAWVTTRKAIASDQLGDFAMPKPQIVLINIYGLHHSPKYWDAPQTFNPDRFLTEANIPKGAYLPFGTGPRKCIGEQLAMTELQMLLASIVQRYTLTVTNEVQPDPVFVLRAKDGIWVQLEKRADP